MVVMELCTGGSLMDVLESPENGYGLNEAHFKQVISDVAIGECDFVLHRTWVARWSKRNLLVLCVHTCLHRLWTAI